MQFVNGIFDGLAKTTIGASFVAKTLYINGQEITISVWDTAGQELYRGLTPMYYRNAAVAIIVFDVTNRESFESVQSWADEIRENTSDAIVLICGNKIDLPDRLISQEAGQKLADSLELPYFETSAATGTGVNEMFTKITEKLISMNSGIFKQQQRQVPVQLEPEPKSSGYCC